MDETPYYVLTDSSTPESRRAAWGIASGLQKIDGIEPSELANVAMEKYIHGEISHQDVTEYVAREYQKHPSANLKSREADETSIRIAKIISEPGFTLSTASFMALHGRIFDGLMDDRRFEGGLRTFDIAKSEPVLEGASVNYTPASELRRTLNWEFEEERLARFTPQNNEDAVSHVLQFASKLWQIHPFVEGNTRTTATYAVKYLRYLGVPIGNEPFEQHSQYFRDALALNNASFQKQDSKPLTDFGTKILNPTQELVDLRQKYPQ
ncbi:MAG: Fic family protein [Cellulomonadaceae bacterium]|jgi:fido (protein-threonine AMPylation protein)|nr:Fic family protein [Cellulomonadaceae bacterium]